MPDLQWILEIVLVALLGVTLFHAIRLERALGVLKRDRASLEELVASFNASTRQAEAGIDRLRTAADGAGRQLARQIETAAALRDDLSLLSQRGENLADQLDVRVRAARPAMAESGAGRAGGGDMPTGKPGTGDGPRPRSQAELDLLKALRMAG
jgi:cell division protein FtsB